MVYVYKDIWIFLVKNVYIFLLGFIYWKYFWDSDKDNCKIDIKNIFLKK